MLMRGTKRHTFQEINRILDNVGASLDFGSGRHNMSFGGQALAEDFGLLVDLMAECLLEPTFPRVELDKLRGQALTHLGILDTDTGYRADRAFMSALYPPDHPYARPVIGNRKTLSVLQAEDLAAFYQQVYHPATLVISVAGAVRADEVIDRLGSTLGAWQVDHPVTLPTVAPVETPDGIITERVQIPGKAQVDLIWGVIGMPRTSPDYYPAVMGNLILGRLGMMGRLGARVRDTLGLAYYISSGVHVGLGPYPWTIMAGVAPENVDAAVQATLEEVERLRDEPIDDEELDDIRTYLTGSLPLHLETNEGLAGFLMNTEEYGLGLDYLQRYSQMIYGIDKGEIQRVVRRYLTLDRYVLAMAGTFR
jgi:zinc protease